MPYFNPTITPIGLSCKHREACLEREVDLSLKLDVDGLEKKKKKKPILDFNKRTQLNKISMFTTIKSGQDDDQRME